MLSVSGAAVILDQWTKYLSERSDESPRILWYGWNVFDLAAVHNSGMALGIDLWDGFPFVAIGIAVITGILLLTYSYRSLFLQRWYLPWAAGMVIGGITGNLIDRVTRGGEVLDFIAIGYFPVFNLADLFLCLGCLVLVRDMYRSSNSTK